MEGTFDDDFMCADAVHLVVDALAALVKVPLDLEDNYSPLTNSPLTNSPLTSSHVPHYLFKVRRGTRQVDGAFAGGAVAALPGLQKLNVELDRLIHFGSEDRERNRQLDDTVD